MVIGKYIYQRLLDHAGTAALVGPRIFAHLAPTAAAKPYVVYSVVSVNPYHTKSGPADVEQVRVQIDVYGTTYANAVAVGQQIRSAIDYVTDPSGDTADVFIDGCHFVNAQNDIEETVDLHKYISDYNFRVKYLPGMANALSVSTIAQTHVLDYTIAGSVNIPIFDVFIQYIVVTSGTGTIRIEGHTDQVLFEGDIQSLPMEIALYHYQEHAKAFAIIGDCTVDIYYIQR